MTALAYKAVLLDLDGTLADTAPDMGAAINALRAEHGLDPLPYSAIRPVVSHGAKGLLTLAFGAELDAARETALRERFLALYEATLCVGTRLFPGFSEVLAQLEAWSVPWGVVTNKPAWLTEPLLEGLQIRARAACIVSGDTVEKAKPDPMPLHHAASLLGMPPAQCLYVGDAERDVQAGQAAGMDVLIADYGYIAESDEPHAWQARGNIGCPQDILLWVNGGLPDVD